MIHGANEGDYDLSGSSVFKAVKLLRDVMNIPDDTIFQLNGKRVSGEALLVAGDLLEFGKEIGCKGLGKLYTKQELISVWKLTDEQYVALLRSGMPAVDVAGEMRHPEYELDDFMTHLSRFKARIDNVSESAHQKSEMLELRRELNGLKKHLKSYLGEREWYSVKEAAEMTGKSEYTIREACNKKRFPEELFEKNPRNNQWRISNQGVLFIKENGFEPST
ncbi:MAG: helix-turn-helix domain-containing protein [Planctomycetaceae bacterium]